MSVESCKGGEINSQQAEAITTIAATNEYKGKSRITTPVSYTHLTLPTIA